MKKSSIISSTVISLVLLAFVSACNTSSLSKQEQPSPQQQSSAPASSSPSARGSLVPSRVLPQASVGSDPQHWEDVDPRLSALATVAKGVDYSNWSSERPAYQYDVEVRLRNKSEAAITFDAAALAFVPERGKPISAVQTERDLRNQEAIKRLRLKPGAEEKFTINSDGYTSDLLGRSEPKPLLFEVTLWLGSDRVAGPFRAELPQLSELPDVTETPAYGVKGGAVYLTFKPSISTSAPGR